MRVAGTPWHPLLVQKVEIHALGFVLHTLRLNRHKETEVAPHAHRYDQVILFVTGGGEQLIGRQRRPAQAGDLFLIPRGVSHGFKPAGAKPLCLVLDYEARSARTGRASAKRARRRHLSPATLDELRLLLAQIPTKGSLRLAHYPPVLQVVALLLSPRPGPAPNAVPEAKAVRPSWQTIVGNAIGECRSPEAIARQAGYHRDHLTRKLKREGGLGLRALRDRRRLHLAESALRAGATIAEAASAATFDDANYFARWFKRRTGFPPSTWQRCSALPSMR